LPGDPMILAMTEVVSYMKYKVQK